MLCRPASSVDSINEYNGFYSLASIVLSHVVPLVSVKTSTCNMSKVLVRKKNWRYVKNKEVYRSISSIGEDTALHFVLLKPKQTIMCPMNLYHHQAMCCYIPHYFPQMHQHLGRLKHTSLRML